MLMVRGEEGRQVKVDSENSRVSGKERGRGVREFGSTVGETSERTQGVRRKHCRRKKKQSG